MTATLGSILTTTVLRYVGSDLHGGSVDDCTLSNVDTLSVMCDYCPTSGDVFADVIISENHLIYLLTHCTSALAAPVLTTQSLCIPSYGLVPVLLGKAITCYDIAVNLLVEHTSHPQWFSDVTRPHPVKPKCSLNMKKMLMWKAGLKGEIKLSRS